MTKDGVGKSEFVQRTQDHLNHYIAAADTKASILLTGHLAFLGLYGNAIKGAFQDPTFLFLVISSFSVASGLIAGVLALLVILPRTPETPTGYILWSSILDMGEENYREAMKNLDSDTAFTELADENYALAKVADKKYKYLRKSLLVTFVLVFFSLISYTLTII